MDTALTVVILLLTLLLVLIVLLYFFTQQGFRDVVARMSAEVQKVLKMPDVVQRFYDFAFIPGGSDPDKFTQIMRGEYNRWEPIVKSVGVQLEL